jgi:hypothetical protein
MNQFHTFLSYFFKIRFNTILSLNLMSSKCSLQDFPRKYIIIYEFKYCCEICQKEWQLIVSPYGAKLSVLYFACRSLPTKKVLRRLEKSSGLIIFGKKAVCSDKQMNYEYVNDTPCHLMLKHAVHIFRAVLCTR